MVFSDITPGTRLELELYDEMGDRVNPILISEFEWAEGSTTAVIAAPIHEGVIYPVRIGTLVNAYLTAGESLYKIRAKVIDRRVKDNIPLLMIENLGNIQMIQRRRFYRFKCLLPIRYRAVMSVNTEHNREIPFTGTVARDISGAGMGILLQEKLEIGQLLEVEITLESHVVKFFGEIVRCGKLEGESLKYKYEAGLDYKKIEDSEREYIISYVFRQQRKLRKKGLI